MNLFSLVSSNSMLEGGSVTEGQTFEQPVDGGVGVRYVSNVYHQYISNAAKCFDLRNIQSKLIELKEPISVVLEVGPSEFVATSHDLNIYGIGDTELEAISDLCETIEELYLEFKKAGTEKLGPEMEKVWLFMKKKIKKCS